MQHVRGHEVFCRGFALGHCATRRGKLNMACKVDAIKFSLFCFAKFCGNYNYFSVLDAGFLH